ncbi:MAG: hypothetical protein KDI98_09270, partial [Hyphomicrobiaceae bacterium]|nr:hypothetical protein [Hyphomicrobiaceae bacterium]
MSERIAAAGLNHTAMVRKRAERRRETSRAVKGVRERMASVTGTRPDFDHQMLTLFVSNHLAASIAVPLVAIVTAIGVGYVTTPTVGIGWLIAVLAANALFALVGKRFLTLDAEEANSRSWGKRFALLHALQGATWALMVVAIAMNQADRGDFVHVLLFASGVIMIAMGSMLSHALPMAAVTISAPMAVALSIHLGLKGDVLSLGMAAIVIGAMIFFLIITQRMHRTTLTMMEARADKDVLIAELEQQRAIAEGARARAEEANLAKSRFLATMSHELRTP